MTLDTHLRQTTKPKNVRYLDATAGVLERFIRENDAKAWTFVTGPASARKLFDAAQLGPAKTTSGTRTGVRARDGRDPAAEVATRHGITLRNRPPAKNAVPLDWLTVLFERDFSNSKIWALVKLGDLPNPRDMHPASIVSKFGTRTLVEMQRRGFKS